MERAARASSGHGEANDRETLADASEKEVNKLLDRANVKRANSRKRENSGGASSSAKRCIWNCKDERREIPHGSSACGAPAAMPQGPHEDMLAQQRKTAEMEKVVHGDKSEDDEDVDWETGVDETKVAECWNGDVTIELESSPADKKRLTRNIRRATAKDKEFAELVHKAHLLCLLARGRLVDAASDDTLLRASMFSLVPPRLIPSVGPEKLSTCHLLPIVKWFNNVFRIAEGSSGEPPSARLLQVLSKQAGSEEEIAAISVVLFRTLGFNTRYVSVLDVAPVKPDAESLEASKDWGLDAEADETSYVQFSGNLGKALSDCARQCLEPRSHKGDQLKGISESERKSIPHRPVHEKPGPSEIPLKVELGGRKRKGDEEFELEMARAMAATAAATPPEGGTLNEGASPGSQKQVATKRPKNSGKATQSKVSTSHWSHRKGPLLHWAEVYCGDSITGRWIHVDAARDIVDDIEKIEAAARKQPVRYVVAFAGSGAKDVTRRYVSAWSKTSGLRVDQGWWDACLFPLRDLEANACATLPNQEVSGENAKSKSSEGALPQQTGYPLNQSGQERSAKEDMELEIRAFTEPLPTNQQAYKNHHLYAMERWLTRYQTLYPKGPLVGYCGGKPVYPRSCVQDLHTKERWLREGFAVKSGEEPVKVVKSRTATPKQSTSEKAPIGDEPDHELSQARDEPCLISLFGKWQTEPWQPPPAVNGIVPKNERGHVDVWSEKCIPPGTVHLRFPRLVPIVRRLGIDFASAMVGFEIRQGRSMPVFEGIVVCEEFEETIMEIYMVEEQQRIAEIQRKREEQAAIRWLQLLRSMATRQRLRAAYEVNSSDNLTKEEEALAARLPEEEPLRNQGVSRPEGNSVDNHVHSFPEEYQSFDKESCIRTKRCACGFQLSVEEMRF